MTTITIDDLHFEVRRSARRRSVQITVDRGGELILTAPESCGAATMEGFVHAKRFWIYTKLAEKELHHAALPAKRYVTGEGFPYLGRSHRLLLVANQDIPVKLEHGRFKMRRADAADGRAHMTCWYKEHAQAWLNDRIHHLAGRVGADYAGITVHDLGYRWGSCGKGGNVHIHWRTILLPPRIIDYVLTHELVHLCEAHHTLAFWAKVERSMPDFASRKQWLAERGSRTVNA
ncbi:MAG: M48 family metallopeptidase [Sandaracinaceae bacterium]|nr:M48 family metallopeptidase [Sandaracinaceae bacterium]